MTNANPLKYHANNPQKADSSENEQVKIEVMKKNLGREVVFKKDNKSYKILGFYDAHNYILSLNARTEPIIVKESMVAFPSEG